MKAVVFSDSHGDTAAMREALEREAPEVVIDEEVRRRAEGSIRRMLQIGRSK